jgi:SAM-dependent methyltransferase
MRVGRGIAGILRHITIHRPRFMWLVGGMLVAVVSTGFANFTNQPGLTLLSIAATMIIGFFLAMNLWAGYKLTHSPDYDQLFEMGNLRQNDTFVLLEFGEKTVALDLFPQLVGGKIIAIDIYNPLLTPSPSLGYARAYFPMPSKDPRLSWRDGHFSRLSLPNNSIDTIMMPHIVSHFSEWGDQKLLLQEVYRLLKPGGLLLFAEQIRTPTQWFIHAWSAGKIESADNWREAVRRTGFQIKEEVIRFDLSLCLRAEKPERAAGKQLGFDFMPKPPISRRE